MRRTSLASSKNYLEKSDFFKQETIFSDIAVKNSVNKGLYMLKLILVINYVNKIK